MTAPHLRDHYIKTNREQLLRIASAGYQNVGRGVVVVLAEPEFRREVHHWKGTIYPYFVEDCLFRRLIYDVWLREYPRQRDKVLNELAQMISDYDPTAGMIVVFLSTDGTVDARHAEVSTPDAHSAAA